jgi:hypothetical protein
VVKTRFASILTTKWYVLLVRGPFDWSSRVSHWGSAASSPVARAEEALRLHIVNDELNPATRGGPAEYDGVHAPIDQDGMKWTWHEHGDRIGRCGMFYDT